MRTVLTGGTPEVTHASVTALLGAGHDVCVAPGDVLDRAGLVAAFEGADVVVNLSPRTPVGPAALLPGAWRRHDRLSTEGVANVVEAARGAGVRRVVQQSVSFLYADHGDEWIGEHCPVEITARTEPAAVGESLVQDHAGGSRTAVVLRFGSVVGDDAQTRHWLRAVARGRAVGIGQPAAWAHVIHTDDLGGAVLAALHAPSGVYNVGAAPVQRRDLVQGYADAAEVESAAFVGPVGRRLLGPRLESLSRSLRVSSDHFAAQTGWRATRPEFDAGWLEAARELHEVRR